MISNIVAALAGTILTLLCIGLCATVRHDDSANDAQRIDFLEGHQAVLIFNQARSEWGVLDSARRMVGYGPTIRVAIDMARAKLESELPLVGAQA